jgi:hypothetical protein
MAIQFPINPVQGQQYTPGGIPLTWQYDSGRHAWRVLRSAASWSEIGGKPATFPPSAHQHPISDVTGLQAGLDLKQDSSARGFPNGYASLDSAGLVPGSQLPPLSETDWNQITNKPSEFPPTTHSHPVAQISDSSSVGQQLVRSPTAQDARNVIGAIGPDDNARVKVKLAGVSMGIRRAINFIEGLNVTLAVADDAVNEEVDVTINSAGGSGGGGGSILVSETKPVAPADSTLWLDSATGITYIYYNDGANHQWIEPLPYIPAQPAAYTKIVFPVAPVNDQAFTAYAGAVWKWSSVRGVWYAALGPAQSYTKAEADAKFVDTVGDTMTGALTLSGPPTAPLQAATKDYVDSKASILISDTPPPAPLDNMLWWESDTGILYIRYNDGTGAQWVQAVATPVPDVSALVKKAGDTMSGNLAIAPAVGSSTLSLVAQQAAQQVKVDFQQGGAVKWQVGKQTDDSFFIYGVTAAKYGFHIDPNTALVDVNADPTAALGIATKQYVDVKTSNRQRFTLDGLSLVDIPVPAGAVAAKLSGSAYFTGGNAYPIVQLSVSPGVFLSTVGNYQFSGNQFNGTAVTWVYYTANASIGGMFLVQTMDTTTVPFTWDATLEVKKRTTGQYFCGNFIAKGFNSVNGHMICNFSNICVASGSALNVLALRFQLVGAGTTFDTNSALIVEWL